MDPTGYWRWWLSGNIYHTMIEPWYEGSLTNPSKQLEIPIPLTPFRHPDMFNSILGDIYEIEPWYLQSAAFPQVLGYRADLWVAARQGSLMETYLGIPYNWNATVFHVGTGIDWPGKYNLPMPNFPAVNLVADYIGSGTVIYWIEPNLLALGGAIPFIVPNKRLVRPPNWVPGKYAPQPAYSVAVIEACGYALMMFGGAIIVVTIVEDFATLGVGVFDDAMTVSAGILLINW